jgi:hypothetical protein
VARRTSTSALTQAGLRGNHRRLLLGFYDRDPGFGRALGRLWIRHARRLALAPDWRQLGPVIWAATPSGQAVRDEFDTRGDVQSLPPAERQQAWDDAFAPAARYLEALGAVSRRYGLDRIGDEGVDVLHAWCESRQSVLASGGHWPTRFFSQGYQFFGPVPEVGDVVEFDVGVLEPDGQRIAIRERDDVTVVHIAGRDDQWDPTMEPYGKAFARLRKKYGKRHEAEIRAELDRRTRVAEQAGARRYDTRPNVRRDAEWLFWHLRCKEGPAAVAARAGVIPHDADPEARDRAIATVTKAVSRFARDADIALHPGWTGWAEGESDDIRGSRAGVR